MVAFWPSLASNPGTEPGAGRPFPYPPCGGYSCEGVGAYSDGQGGGGAYAGEGAGAPNAGGEGAGAPYVREGGVVQCEGGGGAYAGEGAGALYAGGEGAGPPYEGGGVPWTRLFDWPSSLDAGDDKIAHRTRPAPLCPVAPIWQATAAESDAKRGGATNGRPVPIPPYEACFQGF